MKTTIKTAIYTGMFGFMLAASSAGAQGVGENAAFDQLSRAAEKISSIDLNNDPSRAEAALDELYAGMGNSGDVSPVYAGSRSVAGNSKSSALSRADNLYKSAGARNDLGVAETKISPPEPASAVDESSEPESDSGAADNAGAAETTPSSGDYMGESFLLCQILFIMLLLILL